MTEIGMGDAEAGEEDCQEREADRVSCDEVTEIQSAQVLPVHAEAILVVGCSRG